MSVLWFPKPSVDQPPSQAGDWLFPNPFTFYSLDGGRCPCLSLGTAAQCCESCFVQTGRALQLTGLGWHLRRVWHCPGWLERWLIHGELLAAQPASSCPQQLSQQFPLLSLSEPLPPHQQQLSHPHSALSSGLPGHSHPNSHSILILQHSAEGISPEEVMAWGMQSEHHFWVQHALSASSYWLK